MFHVLNFVCLKIISSGVASGVENVRLKENFDSLLTYMKLEAEMQFIPGLKNNENIQNLANFNLLIKICTQIRDWLKIG